MPTSSLQQLTRAIIETIGQFRDMLVREVDSLADGNFDALSSLTDQKLAMAEKLDFLERERQQALQELGYRDFGADTMATALQDTEEGQGLWKQWQAALDCLSECAQLNSQSNAILQAQTQYTQRALEILAGGLSLPVTYGPDGQNGVTPTGHRLGKA